VKRSSLTLFVLLVGWLISLGVFYALGLFSAFAFHRAPEQSSLEGLSQEERELALLVSVYLDEPVEWSELKSTDGEGVPAQVQRLLASLARQSAERREAARLCADLVPSRRVVPMVQYLSQLESPTPAEEELRVALVGRWGKIDGRSALDFALAASSDRLVTAALEGWSMANPSAAWEWVTTAGGSSWTREDRYTAILSTADWTDAEAALRLNELEDRLLALDLSSNRALDLYVREGVTRAFAFSEVTTNDLASRTQVLMAVLVAWTRDAPSEARVWVERIPVEQRDWALVGYARARAPFAPEETLNWLAAQPAGSGAGVAMREVAETWLDADGPAALGDFLNRAENFATFQPVVEPLVMATLDYDPATAFSWSELVANDSRRLYLQLVIAMRWEEIDPEGAGAFLAQLAGQSGTVQAVSAAEVEAPIEVAPGETLVIEAPAAEEAVEVEEMEASASPNSP
jgi:hypothetical protein